MTHHGACGSGARHVLIGSAGFRNKGSRDSGTTLRDVAGQPVWPSSFFDLHQLEACDDDLSFARTLVDDILDRAILDESGMRWSNYEYRKDEPHLPPETGYMQGASGIGSTLLRLHRHLNGDRWTVSWPHTPGWDPQTEQHEFPGFRVLNPVLLARRA